MNCQKRTLKDGKLIEIRTAKPYDAQNLVNLKRSYIKNTSTIPMYIHEYPNDSNKEEELIQGYLESPNSILLVAEYENQLIGNIDLTGSKRIKMNHTGMIGMGIREEWRNKGLGKELINAVIEWAKNSSTIELIWLDVYESNEIGINLYKNTGFAISGIIKGFFKDKDGYNDKVQMYQRITKNRIEENNSSEST